MKRSHRAGWAAALAAASSLGLAACGESKGTVERTVGEARVVDGADTRFGAAPRDRFGLGMMPGAARADAPTPAAAKGQLSWTTPEGWTEVQGSATRPVNLLVMGDPRAECYLAELPGESGGLLANVNRWRGQMGLPPVGPDEVEKMPRRALLGREAALIDVEGSYSGMSGSSAEADYRMVGLLGVHSGGSAFLKMVGPKDVLDDQLPRFLALARSLQRGADAGQPPAAESTPSGGADKESAGGLAWSAPAAWKRVPGQQSMRLVTYTAGETDSTECYVTLLSGDGGGAIANANRWRDQVGLGPLTQAEIDDLPRIPMLNGEALLVEARGHYTGMGGESVPEATVLGAIRIVPQAAVFVKMIGPSSVIDAERQAFLEFCKSLEPSSGS